MAISKGLFVKISLKISFKKIVELCPFGMLYFSIHRVKVGKKWGRYLVFVADALGYRAWWL